MKKITMSLISLIVLGTSTGFCKSTPKSNNGSQPRQEVIQDQRQKITPETKGNTYQLQGKDFKPGNCKKTKCNCNECQKKSKKKIGKHQVEVRKSQLKQHCPKK